MVRIVKTFAYFIFSSTQIISARWKATHKTEAPKEPDADDLILKQLMKVAQAANKLPGLYIINILYVIFVKYVLMYII